MLLPGFVSELAHHSGLQHANIAAEEAGQPEQVNQQPCFANEHSRAGAVLNTSYQRVHGTPPRTPAQWTLHKVVCKEELREVLYHKAEGEGIAKVLFPRDVVCACVSCVRLKFGRQIGWNEQMHAGHDQSATETQCLYTTHRSRNVMVLNRCS